MGAQLKSVSMLSLAWQRFEQKTERQRLSGGIGETERERDKSEVQRQSHGEEVSERTLDGKRERESRVSPSPTVRRWAGQGSNSPGYSCLVGALS